MQNLPVNSSACQKEFVHGRRADRLCKDCCFFLQAGRFQGRDLYSGFELVKEDEEGNKTYKLDLTGYTNKNNVIDVETVCAE